MLARVPRLALAGLTTAVLLIWMSASPSGGQAPLRGQAPTQVRPEILPPPPIAAPARPDFLRQVRDQAETDRRWQEASEGFMRMEKISFRSMKDDLEIPAFIFQPLKEGPPRQLPALVWVHENIRGHLYEHYIPYIREATAHGFVVIAPEYRGSVGYGKAFYDAIDYGGAEVDDVVMAASVVAARVTSVDPTRVGIIGWSHGGLISLLAVTRYPTTFKAAVAMVPVTNLFHRLARKGIERQRREIDPQNRFGGGPAEKPEVYRARSPLFQIDRLQIPLLVHVADNDQDVDIDESMQLVDALRARKPNLASVKVYRSPVGGHMFDRRVSASIWQPENTPEQRDSWARIWTFLDTKLLTNYN